MADHTHTPAPWTAGNVGVIWAPDGSHRIIVARVGAFQDKEVLHFSRERWTADARLIAAAPELLAALEELGQRFSQLAFTFGVWDQVQDSLAQIDAVQKKARGEASDAG